MKNLPVKRLKGLRSEVTKHGKRVWYYRPEQGGRRIRLLGEPYSEAFLISYNEARKRINQPRPTEGFEKGTIAWLADQYKRSRSWEDLAPSTKRAKDLILKKIVVAVGKYEISQLDTATIERARDARRDRPESANGLIKTLRTMFAWAQKDSHMSRFVTSNPAAKVEMISQKGDGFHTWTAEELSRFESVWAFGTRERLAYEILLYTGLRRSDVVRLSVHHIRDGILRISPQKTPNTRVTLSVIPKLAEALAHPLDPAPKDGPTFIRNANGSAMKPESFTNWFREACTKAGVPGSAHGLRKAAATQLAEAGASEKTLQAVFGWTSPKQAQNYTKAADTRYMGIEGSLLFEKIATRESRTTR